MTQNEIRELATENRRLIFNTPTSIHKSPKASST